MMCRCRFCGCKYDEDKSTADWKGYCTQRCFHAKARDYGYKPSSYRKYGREHSEYSILSRRGQIGSVPWREG